MLAIIWLPDDRRDDIEDKIWFHGKNIIDDDRQIIKWIGINSNHISSNVCDNYAPE